MQCEILIVGGGMGAVAAAITALESGRRVIITEPTDWLGGQVSQQGVPPDENFWIETFGGTQRYKQYRQAVRDYYRKWFPLNRSAFNNPNLNPGGGNVSRISHLPRVSAVIFESILKPFEASGQLKILFGFNPISADVDGDVVRSVTIQSASDKRQISIEANIVIDASETGELLPLTGCEYVTGFESQAEHNEPHAPAQAQPMNMQACTWCFAMDMADGNYIIDKPANYDKWRNYHFPVTPAWPGPLFSWTDAHPHTLKPREQQLETFGENRPKRGTVSMWDYRKVIDPTIFDKDAKPKFNNNPIAPGATVMNWPQCDYVGGELFECENAQDNWLEAKEQSLNFFYWLQTEAPRADGGTGFPGLRLRPDVMGTEDGFAKHPYIRESRRIKALFTVTENHVGQEARGNCGKAEKFKDSIGIGYYRLDLHPSTGGDNYIDIASYPFQIPMGALIPQRINNLLPACKNIGTTHISNGCYRLHPIEWAIGEAVGALADTCLAKNETPCAIHSDKQKLSDFQNRLLKEGMPIEWPNI